MRRDIHPGFTLLELLAVTSLLALAASVTVRFVVSSGGAAVQREAAAVRDADRRARLHAVTAGTPVVLEIVDQGRSLVVRGEGRDPLYSRVVLAPGLVLQCFSPDGRNALRHVRVDPRGRSVDYRVRVASLRKNDRASEWLCAGLTGSVVDIAVEVAR